MTAKEAKIAVYGAGAMGTVLGGLLAKGGLNVHLITRNEGHVQGLKKAGAQIECRADCKTLTIPVIARTPKEMERYDVIFLMTKQRHNAEIIKTLLPCLNEKGILCTTQNGLPENSLLSELPPARVFGAATSFGATFIGEGRVALTSKIEAMRMEIGCMSENEEGLALLKEMLSIAGNAVENPTFAKETENLLGARWSKLAINAAFSGLSVITGRTFGEVAKKRKSRKIALAILRECMQVATASKVTLAPMQGKDMQKLLGGKTPIKRAFAYLVLPIAMKKHKRLVSGMLQDVRAGRRCEIDFINGAVVKAGEKVGVPTPYCERVVELVHGIEDGLYETDYKNVDFFADIV